MQPMHAASRRQMNARFLSGKSICDDDDDDERRRGEGRELLLLFPQCAIYLATHRARFGRCMHDRLMHYLKFFPSAWPLSYAQHRLGDILCRVWLLEHIRNQLFPIF